MIIMGKEVWFHILIILSGLGWGYSLGVKLFGLSVVFLFINVYSLQMYNNFIKNKTLDDLDKNEFK